MRSTPKSGRSKSVSQLIATVQSWLVGLLPALNSKYSAMILKWEPLETLCMPSRDRRYPKLRWAVVVLSLWVAYSMWPWFHEQVVRRVYVTVKPCLPPVDPIVEKEFWHGNFGPGEQFSHNEVLCLACCHHVNCWPYFNRACQHTVALDASVATAVLPVHECCPSYPSLPLSNTCCCFWLR